MRDYQFQLRLPDGRIVAATASAQSWQWAVAFTEACLSAERDYELGPWAGISCESYSSQPSVLDRPPCPVDIDEAGTVRMSAWATFRSAA